MLSQTSKNIFQDDGEMETTLAVIDKVSSVIGWKPEVDVLEWIQK